MKLKTLKLENIRSYESAELRFGNGKTLLSGDIGSGKTTVLLSIEFALFGSLKGILQANNLLRRGSSSGLIELNFEIEDKDITITRSIKSQNNKISQQSNILKINGVEENLTPVEMKSRVLSLLGYPEDLVTKSKSLIYRYTVYTPQEEMKSILFENSNDRLEKIRKIIGVDKYKTIIDNASEYVKDLKQEIKELDIKTEDLQELVKKKSEKEKAMKELEGELVFLNKQLNEESSRFKQKKEYYDELEKKINLYKEWEHEQKIKELNLKNILDNVDRLKSENEDIKKSIEQEKFEELEKPVVEETNQSLEKTEANIKKLEENISKARSKKAVLLDKKKESENLINNIEELDTCPKCYQKVTPSHKEEIRKEEEKNIKENKQKISKYKEFIEKANNQKEQFLAKKKKLEEQKYENIKLLQKIKNQEEKKKRISLNKEKLEKNTQKIAELEKQKSKLEQKTQKPNNPQKEWETAKKEMEELKNNIYSVENKINSKKEILSYHEKDILEYNKEIEKRKRIKEIIIEKEMHRTWITKHLIKLASDVEKSVLAKIYKEFNEYFKDWFDELLEDEVIQADLDEEFTPRIIQNGYEASLEDLSGGEKTATALAYRLALNKVINNYVGNMKTTDLLILDEPTDGFSNDQLDSLRDVLEDMNTEQIIIVSHEAKMESMVENIIKITKNEHTSMIE